jgi:hypothetical protein
METALVTPSEQSARQRRGAISRKRAFLTHLSMSALIVGAACALIFLLWYPRPYFQAVGAWNVLRVLIGVDLVVGPLLTLLVFKPGKPGLKFDLSVIALVQLAALTYGLMVIYDERPYFTVFALDRFFVLARQDVDLAQLADAQAAGRLDDKPSRGPMLVVATRPTGAAFQKLLDETVFGGKPDIERRPEFWSRYEVEAAQVTRRAQPLATLQAARPDDRAKIAALQAKLGLAAERIAFVPMIAKNRDVSLLVDSTTGSPLDVVDVDPWIAAAHAEEPGSGAPPATR